MNLKQLNTLLKRAPSTHKGQKGHVLVIAGSTYFSGAALLAAVSSHRIGADLVTLAAPKEVCMAANCYSPDLITIKLPGTFLKQSHYSKIIKMLDKYDVIIESGIKRINISLDTLNPVKFKQIARGGDLDVVLNGIEATLNAGIKVKINMVPLRQNTHEIVTMLDYCLERGIELRFIELMRMGHLLNSNDFQQDFLSMESLLDEISSSYEFARTDAPHDSTAARFEIPHKGVFGIIANESEPFCRSCTRLRLSSDGYLYGCLSNSQREYIGDLLELPPHVALPKFQKILVKALADKKLAFQGETTVMKLIGG